MMRQSNLNLVGLIALAAASLIPATVPACNVPVFRFALERWNADPYVLVIFYREPLSAEQQGLVQTMEKTSEAGLVNLRVCRVDVAKELSAPFRALWKNQDNPALPWMVVRYPAQTGIESPVWSGPLSAEAVKPLADSPKRREIASRLLKGETGVWLLLESGDQPRNDAVCHLLETESRNLERTLALPEPAPDDPPLNSDLPLKIAFSTIRVARSDPGERLLVNQLLNWNPQLTNTTQPILFPVFGRGRVLPPAVGEGIRNEVIGRMAGLLTGPCSCQIKEMNVGYDLLMTARWEALQDGRVVKEPEPPPLVGLTRFANATTNNSLSPSNPPSLSPSLAAAVRVPAVRSSLVRNLMGLLAISVVFLSLATLVLNGRAKIRRRNHQQGSFP